MADIEQLVKTTLGEIERILSSKSVVGEPMTVEGNTIIPLVSIGFGFGGGGGTGSGKDKSEGSGAGTGGGGGIKPVGVIVISKDGVKVEPIRGRMAGVVEAVTEGIGTLAEKRRQKKEAPAEEE
jgi:uncharacterized spore protein YtfJ